MINRDATKEYYQDTGILRVYTSTLTRILEAFEGQGAQVSQSDSDKSQRRFWPPFPWPREFSIILELDIGNIPLAWGDDDDETPTKKTPRELAESVVEFEGRIAEASLDLCEISLFFLSYSIFIFFYQTEFRCSWIPSEHIILSVTKNLRI